MISTASFVRRAHPLLMLAGAAAISGCVHATATSSPPVKEAAAMTARESTSTVISTLSAEEIGKRFLKLIEGLESRDDLSLERINSALGITMRRYDGTPDYLYGYGQALDEGWDFGVTYIAGDPPSLLRGVKLDFGKGNERFAPMPAAVCVLDFDHYHNAMVAMGFLAQPHYGEIGQILSWHYTKFKKSGGAVDMTFSIIPQNIVPGEAGRLCVKAVGTLN